MSISDQELEQVAAHLFEGVDINSPNIEIEARIGFFGERGNFISNVPPKQFFKAIKYFEDNKFIKTRNRRSTTDETYRSKDLLQDPDRRKRIKAPKYRKTIWEYPTGKINESWITKKQETDNINIPSLNMRISRQTESPIENPNDLKNLVLESVRSKNRTSFTDPEKTAYIDFTVVTTKGPPEKTTYEVEVEMREPKKENIPQFFETIKMVLKAIQQTEVITTVDERTQVIGKFNNIFGVNKKSLHNNFFSKPVDLTFSNFEKMFGEFKYNITEKSDGERGFLFIIDEGVFIIQPPFGINKLSETPNDLKEFRPSLFDCEIVTLESPKRNIILIFDTLLFKGINMRTYTFYPRISKARELTSPAAPTNPNNFNKLTTYKLNDTTTINVKGFKFFTNADEMFALVNEVNKEIMTQDWGNDGCIFTPVNEVYETTGIYKFKPEHLLTIDFLIQKGVPYSFSGKLDSEGKPEYVPFEGTDLYPYYNKLIYYGDNILSTKVIWECKFDRENNRFIPIRQRSDRQTANKLEVAKSVWNNIMNPIGSAIYGKGIDFYLYRIEMTKIKMLQKYAGKNILDINTKDAQTFTISRILNINMYFLNPEVCALYSYFLPEDRVLLPGQGMPNIQFDAISCFSVLNFYNSPKTILELGSKILKPGGKIFGIFLDISDFTFDELKKFEKVKMVPKMFEDGPGVIVYFQRDLVGNSDIIYENKYVLFPSEIEAMAKHYGFKTRFHGNHEYNPSYDTQDNLLITTQKQFVFEKIEGLHGPPVTPKLIPKFFKETSEEELETTHSHYMSKVYKPTPPYMPQSPQYVPDSPEYRPTTPPI